MRWCRPSADYGNAGAAIGLLLSIIQFVVLMGFAFRIDSGGKPASGMACTCVLRLIAILGLTLGTGIGYMVARAIGG